MKISDIFDFRILGGEGSDELFFDFISASTSREHPYYNIIAIFKDIYSRRRWVCVSVKDSSDAFEGLKTMIKFIEKQL